MKVRMNADASFAIAMPQQINKLEVVRSTPWSTVVVESQRIIDSSSAQECKN